MHLSAQTRAKVELYKRGDFSTLILSDKQREALGQLHPSNKTTRVLTYGGGAGGGKSWFICVWEILNALAYPECKQYISRNELKRLMSSTYVTFMKVAKDFGLVQGVHWSLNGKYNYITFFNGSRIDLLDVSYQPRDPLYERFGSTEYTCGANEEAGEIDFGAFEILYTRTGRHLNREYDFYPKNLNTANPKKNWLYRYFYKPWKKGTLEKGYYFIQALIKDNLFIDPEYIKSLENTKDEVKKQRLLYGNWEYEGDPRAIIDYDKIVDIWQNDHVPHGRKYITADVAGMGSDLMVFMVWSGFRVIHTETLAKNDGPKALAVFKRLKSRYQVANSSIAYDVDGVGSYLRGFLPNAKPFVNNSVALKKQNYANLKTQCYFLLAEKINDGGLYIDHNDYEEKTTQELEQVKKDKVDTEGKLRLVPKDEIREAIGRSPDFSDTLAFRMIFEITTDTKTNHLSFI